MLHRLALLAALAVLAAPGALAQSLVACQGGTAAGFACDGVDLHARIPTGTDGPLHTGATNDIWGWTDPQDGREYALSGTRSGTVFVDVTDPESPAVLGKLLTATENSTWRDIKVYQNHAFVVSEADGHGMQVFDLTRLRGLAADDDREFAADLTYTGAPGHFVGGAHNVAINEGTGFAYVVGSDDCAGGLHMVDISAPLAPVFAGCFSAEGYTHDAQCVVYDGPDTDYTDREICVASNGDDTVIVDVTDKASPDLVSRIVYPSTAYAHQGWFTEDKRHFLADDESDEFNFTFPGTRTIVFDVEDLDSPGVAFMYYGPVGSSDHNLYIRGQYAFLSNYESGLRVLDLSGIDSGVLTEVGFFDTYLGSDAAGFGGQWSNYPFFESGTVVANDQDFGLFVLRPGVLATANEPPAPEIPAGAGYVLGAPSPNPFASATVLSLAVARAQAVRAEVLDVNGRRVAVLHDGPVAAEAAVALRFDGADLASGLYLVRVVGEDFTALRRVSLVR